MKIEIPSKRMKIIKRLTMKRLERKTFLEILRKEEFFLLAKCLLKIEKFLQKKKINSQF